MTILTAAEYVARVRQSGSTLAEICRKAGIAPSTLTRWQSGETEPTLSVYRRLIEAVEAKERQ